MAKASPLEDFLSTIDPPLRPLVRYDVGRTRPLSNLQLSSAQQAITTGKPVFKTSGDQGILHDIVGLPGNFVRDATQTVQGVFSPWVWAPAILHDVTTGQYGKLAPLIPGYSTAKAALSGDFHSILSHPAGTVLDVLPYAHAVAPAVGRLAGLEDAAKTATVDELTGTIKGSREARIGAALEGKKPGRAIYNLLPDTITNPDTGFVGKRLEDLHQAAAVARQTSSWNRAFQKVYLDEYFRPMQDAFKDFNPEERAQFSDWITHYNENNPTQWTDTYGNTTTVPQKFVDAYPKYVEIAKKVEKAADPLLQKIWYDGRQYLYHTDSPVVKGLQDVSAANRGVEEAQQAARAARATFVEHQLEEVQPKTPLTTTKVIEPGSKATFEVGQEGISPVEPRPPVYSTVPRKSLRLFQVQDQIDQIQGRLKNLYGLRSLANDRPKWLGITSRIERAESKLSDLNTLHEQLSRREILVSGLRDNPTMHVSPEDYNLLDLNVPGEKRIAQNYKRALAKLDEARANASATRLAFDKTLSTHAPATFMPQINDIVLRKVAEKFKASHPDFMDGVSTFDPELVRQAIEEHTLGLDPVAGKMLTQPEMNAIVNEVHSSWQEMAQNGFAPMYMSSVPESRFRSVLDPNLLRSAAAKDLPFAVRGRVADITPSGIKDPVIGLTAPALAILRRNTLREFYSTFLAPFLKSEEDLNTWLDNEIQQGDFQNFRPGETLMDRRNAIKADRWRPFDKAKVDPELAAQFPDGMYLPKEMHDSIVQLFKPGSDQLKSVSKVNIHGMRIFRTAVMALSAKHLAHVFFGGLAMILGRGKLEELTPERISAAWQMAKNDLLPKDLSAGVDFYNARQMAAGALPEAERTSIPSKVAGKVGDVVTKVQSIEERISNFERALSYMSERDRILAGKTSPNLNQFENAEVKAALERGDTQHAVQLAERGAITHANKALIDFDGMLPAERGIIRNIFPFWAFTRHIFKYALQYPIDYPLRATFVYRLGQIAQDEMQNQGLPENWMRFLSFGPDQEGNVTNVDLRFLNPFRSLPDVASGAGTVNTLNPFLGYALEWAGVNPWTTSADRFPDIRYNPQTGYVETKRKPFSLLGLISTLVPEAGVLGGVTGDQTASGVSNKLSRYGFLPLIPHSDNVNLQRATDTLAQFEVAQGVVNNALKSGDTSELKTWSVVPVPGQQQLIPGKLLARIIDSLPSGKGTPRQKLGLR